MSYDKVGIDEHQALLATAQRMRDAMRAAANELGMPQPGYPAPVVNACNILLSELIKSDVQALKP